MLRYLRLLKSLARYQLMREMEFSINFFVSISIHLFFIASNLLFFSLIWYQVGGFGGLTPDEMLFFIGTFHLVDAIFMVFTFFGILEVPTMVRNGDMDFILTKPVQPQFLTTFRYFSWFSLTDFFVAIGLISYALLKMKLFLSLWQLGLYAVMVIIGSAISYAMSCIVMSLSFRMVSNDAIWTIYFEMGEFEKQPIGIYPPPWKMLFTITLPFVIIANFPTYFALGKLTLGQFLWFFILGALLIYVSHRFWQYNLKKYQSASS